MIYFCWKCLTCYINIYGILNDRIFLIKQSVNVFIHWHFIQNISILIMSYTLRVCNNLVYITLKHRQASTLNLIISWFILFHLIIFLPLNHNISKLPTLLNIIFTLFIWNDREIACLINCNNQFHLSQNWNNPCLLGKKQVQSKQGYFL